MGQVKAKANPKAKAKGNRPTPRGIYSVSRLSSVIQLDHDYILAWMVASLSKCSSRRSRFVAPYIAPTPTPTWAGHGHMRVQTLNGGLVNLMYDDGEKETKVHLSLIRKRRRCVNQDGTPGVMVDAEDHHDDHHTDTDSSNIGGNDIYVTPNA